MIPQRTLARAATLIALAGMTSPVIAQIANGGFEIGDADPFADYNYYPNTFADWLNIPNRDFTTPIYQELDPAFVHSGLAAAKIFGQFNGAPNASLVTQDIPATPGNLYQLDVWHLHSSADPITGVSTGFVSIEFYDGVSASALTITTHDVTNAGSLQDVYQNTFFGATAPPGATIARIGLGHFQLNSLEAGSTFYDDAELLDLGTNTGLQNPSFDTYVPTGDFQPDACCVPGWMTSANNTYVNRTFKKTGNSALIMYGQFNGLANTSVVWQDLPVSPGELVDASAFAGHVNGDALQLDNTAFMSVEFYDAGAALLEITRLTLLDASSPTGSFLPGAVSATAPAGAATARLQLGFFQSDATTGMPAEQGTGAAYIEDVAIDFPGPNLGLINPSFDSFNPGPDFEPDPDDVIPGWTASVPATNPNFGQAQPAADGEFAAFLFGLFPGDNSPNDTVLYQDAPVSPGEGVQVDAQVYHDPGDPLGPDNVLSLTIDFLDAGLAPLGSVATSALTSVSPQGVYIPASVSGTAPAGAAFARINFVYSQANEGTGAAFFDDVQITYTPPAPCLGDLNADNATNVIDFSIWVAAFGTTLGDPNFNPDADYDNNNTVNVLDFSIWVADFGCPN